MNDAAHEHDWPHVPHGDRDPQLVALEQEWWSGSLASDESLD